MCSYHGHCEYCCGENLELVSDLVGGHVKITGSHVQQVVLDQIHSGGNHHLQRERDDATIMSYRVISFTFTVSIGCFIIVLSSAVHHLLRLLSSLFQTRPRQVTSFTNSAMKTAVVEMNMSPGLVLA